MTSPNETEIELAKTKEALDKALAANHRLSNQMMQQTTRYQEQMRPHLRNAWMKGHNAGWWNGRESVESGVDRRNATVEALARGLADCPYIKDAAELEAVAAEYKVVGVGNSAEG